MSLDNTASERRTVIEEQRGRTDRTRSGAEHLARLELSQTWPSYLSATLVALFVGLLAMALLQADPQDGYGNGPVGSLLDVIFLFLLANLGINWTSFNWTFVHTDPFTPRLSFLRTLPIPVRDLILSRLMIALTTTTVTSLAFFVPSYALFSSLRMEIPPVQFLWFALFWIGYVLFSAGLLLFLEGAVKGAWALVVCLVWATLLFSLVVLAQMAGVPLVGGSLSLVQNYGPLVAIPALVIGGVGLLLWCRLLWHRTRTRELSL